MSSPTAIVLSLLMVLPITESPSRLFNYFPMPAFVGTDAAKALRVLIWLSFLSRTPDGPSMTMRWRSNAAAKALA